MNKINTLCFSSGGINCASFLGALNYLINHDVIYMNNINTFIGSSGGALIAYLLSINYTVDQIINFLFNNDLQFITNININNIFYKYSIYHSNKIIYVLKYLLISKLNKNDITFIELFNLTNNNLIINGTKINNNKIEEILFNKDNHPNMSILLALRISISIPIIFKPIYYKNNYYIDGGIINDFPYNYCNPETTLGFYVNNINPLNFIFNGLYKSKKIYNYKYVIVINIINNSNFDISINYFKYIISYGKLSCKNNIKSNFNYNINYNINYNTYYNHIYYILLAIFLLFVIYKYLWKS
jgi:hypothetical protein